MTHPEPQPALDLCPMPMWTMRPDGTVIQVNPAWRALVGSCDDTAPDTGWLSSLHPDDVVDFRARLRSAAATAGRWTIEARLRCADGTFRWHLLQVAPFRDANGAPDAWVGTAIDIDQRRRREADLRAREAGLRSVIESATDIVYTLALDGTVTAVNPAVTRILGYAPGEVLGRSIEELVIPPDQLDFARGVLRRKLAGEESSTYELVVRARDGQRVTLEINSHLAVIDGQPVAIHGIARDITARKQSQEALARLAAIVEDSEDAIVSMTLDGTITSWNRGAERLFGYSAEEMIGDAVDRLVPPDRRAELAGLVARLGRGERMPTMETVRLRKGGTPVDVASSLSPLTDANGRVVGISTIVRDITARKRANARLQVLAEAARVLASDLDVDAQLQRVARLAVPTLADWCVVDVVEKGSDLRRVAVAHVDPAKLTMAEELQRRYPPEPDPTRGPLRVMLTGEPDLMTEIPDELIAAAARDGEHLRLLRAVGLRSYLTVPLRARGRILGTLSFVSAESGRRYGPEDLAIAEALAEPAALAIDNAQLFRSAQEAEVRYRKVFTGVAEAILIADAERRYVDANPATTELLGYRRDELLTMRIDDVVMAGSGWTEREYAGLLKEGRWQGELELRRKDGTTVPVEALATVVELPTEVLYLVALRDVSERRRLERLRRDFLAMVTHDLRTPLSAIKGNAQLLRRRGEYRPAQIEAILGAAGQMQRLIDDLADVVRHEAGSLTLRREIFDLRRLVEEVAGVAQETIAARRVSIVLPTDAVLGAWDRHRLGQVLANLLENTVKYASAEREVVLRVEDRGEEAWIAVTDHGPGIAPEHLSRLFDRFYRADVTGAGGLGLGLYISRMLVEAHGGRIWVESEVGAGSTFTVALPKGT